MMQEAQSLNIPAVLMEGKAKLYPRARQTGLSTCELCCSDELLGLLQPETGN